MRGVQWGAFLKSAANRAGSSEDDGPQFGGFRLERSSGSLSGMHGKILALFVVLTLASSGLNAAEPAPGKQVEQTLKLPDGKSISYLLYLPRDYTGEGKNWPLMLFLHGRGESNGPLSVVRKWGPPKRLDLGEHLSYIVVSPQCPRESFWSREDQQALLLQLLDHLAGSLKVDSDRVYLTGLSMGGFGSWRLAADHPGRFAAVVPVCGAGDPADGEKLKNLPIWVWHGTEDRAVPYAKSVEMVEAIKAAGGTNVLFTTLHHIGHVSWEAAYTAPDLYDWLDKQTVSANRARQNAR